jgi:ATP-binding cassette subfamily F protein 3
LLDEPTNHLDLEMRHALNLALQDFTGAMVLVSHDRYLLRSVTDRWLLVAARAVQPFEGDLDDYRQWLTGQRRLEKEGEADKPDAPHSATVRKERRRQEAEQRRRLQPLRQEVQRLEQALERLSTEQATLKEQLADPRLYEVGAKEQLKALLMHQARADQALSETEEAWLAASEALEAAEQKA